MLNGARILICEDEPYIALDLALSVEDAGGVVVGPAASVKEAEGLLRSNRISGAILDVNLADGHVGPVARELIDRNIPIVVQTGVGLPSEIAHMKTSISVLLKPVSPDLIVMQLARKLNQPGPD